MIVVLPSPFGPAITRRTGFTGAVLSHGAVPALLALPSDVATQLLLASDLGFLQPGKRLKLHPEDLYAYGLDRGGIDERWFASTTPAANENRTPDEGLSYCVVGNQRFTLQRAVAGVFMLVDAGFFVANFAKVAQGGYVPLILAALVYGVMLIWHLGATAVSARLQDAVMPVDAFMARIAEGSIPRVPGTAVFLTRTQREVPPVMVWHVKHNRALHERVFVLTVTTQSVPWVKASERLTVEAMAPGFWRAAARYGFMERPDIPALLQQAHEGGCAFDLSDVTYYVGHETVVPGDEEKALPRMVEALFAFMQRNSAHLTEYFRLPIDAVVEIGREVSIRTRIKESEHAVRWQGGSGHGGATGDRPRDGVGICCCWRRHGDQLAR